MGHWRRAAVLRETLRLNAPASMRTVRTREDTTLGRGKYFIDKNCSIVINAWTVMRDPKVWGDDVCQFVSAIRRLKG